jgi:hypothetical protein
MNDNEIKAQDAPQKSEPKAKAKTGGWPKGRPRGARMAPKSARVIKEAADRAELRAKTPLISKMKARPNWETDDFNGGTVDEADLLRIPETIVQDLARDGIALMWATHSIRGMDAKAEYAKATRAGWTPVHADDFNGVLDDGRFVSKGSGEQIMNGDCILVARPMEIESKARFTMRRDAIAKVESAERTFKETGIMNVTGANHPNALRGNHVTKTIERLEIPTDR